MPGPPNWQPSNCSAAMPSCAIVQNAPDDPPVMDVEEIVELEASGEPSIPPGRIWYAMKPSVVATLALGEVAPR